ncbi:MAG: PQQ-binding-like beta-propeller repeat protein [Pirellulaceae bacterium]
MRLRFVACLMLAAVPLFAAADWLQFRGPGALSVAEDAKLPTALDAENNVAWKAKLPAKGVSSPIVVRDRVIVTSAGGVNQNRLFVDCFDMKSGDALWQRQFWATGRTYTHPSSSVAAPTPASDGERIFAFFSSNDLICLDLDGNLLWYRGLAYDYPKAGNDIGMASSPVVIDETVVVQIENQGDSFAAGLDAATGETRWRLERDKSANWVSPTVLPATSARKPLLVLQDHSGVLGLEPRSGKQVWNYETTCGGVPSPTATEGYLFVSSNGLTALRLSSESASPELAWDEGRLQPGSASPVVYDDRVFTLNGGVLSCGNIDDGEVLWKLRVGGKHWATPVVAGGHMYLANQDGDVRVVKLGEEGEIVSDGKLGEGVQGSPAIAGDALFIRTNEHLWKFESK